MQFLKPTSKKILLTALLTSIIVIIYIITQFFNPRAGCPSIVIAPSFTGYFFDTGLVCIESSFQFIFLAYIVILYIISCIFISFIANKKKKKSSKSITDQRTGISIIFIMIILLCILFSMFTSIYSLPGQVCGGNIMNAKSCFPGYSCISASNIADRGGLCK